MNNTIPADIIITADGKITLSDDNMNAVKQAMKIGFYRSFFNKGIINAAQFDKLMKIQNEKTIKKPA